MGLTHFFPSTGKATLFGPDMHKEWQVVWIRYTTVLIDYEKIMWWIWDNCKSGPTMRLSGISSAENKTIAFTHNFHHAAPTLSFLYTKHDSLDFHFYFEQKLNLTDFTFPVAIWVVVANTQPNNPDMISKGNLKANCIQQKSEPSSLQTSPKPNVQKSKYTIKWQII